MRRLIAVAVLFLAGCGEAPPPAGPVVLWESAGLEPRFPAPPEAAWEPVYQRLRRELEARGGGGRLWVCYSSADGPDRVAAFYVAEAGVSLEAVGWTELPAADVFAQIREVSAELGREIPAAAGSGVVRRGVLRQHGELPMVMLESPYPDADSGVARAGTLVSMAFDPPDGVER